MANCVVKSCKSKNRELFCPPDDKNKLRKWKQILGTEDSNFLICEVHFDQKFIGREKFLQQNAYPSILINTEEYSDSDYCQCCLKTFESNDARLNVSEKLQKIFENYTNFQIELNSYVCIECHDKLLDIDNFLKSVVIKHEIKLNQMAIKSEPVVEIDEEEDEDEGEVQSSSEMQEDEHSFKRAQDEIIQAAAAAVAAKRPVLFPRKIETLLNNCPDGSTITTPSGNLKRIRLNRSESSTHDHEFLSNLNLQCKKCYQTFPTNQTLKLHHETDHQEKGRNSVRKSTTKFSCVPQCGNSFDTYHFLQKHREECQYCPRLKCNQPYCRARFSTVEELIEHQKGHDSLRCRECKLEFSSFEELNEHQLTDHRRLLADGVSRRSRGRPRKLRPEDQIFEDAVGFESLALEAAEDQVKCLKCEMLIYPTELSTHMKEFHDKNRNSN